ncbi:MAG TPA: DUF6788 family protein [Thermoanaerobaculia bacterium]
MPEAEEVPEAVRILAEQLSQARPLRRGSLGERYIKCGKPNCSCATSEEARHGPYFSLTRGVDGQTRSRRLTAQQAERVREQLVAGQQFRRQVEAYWQASETWAEAQLDLVAAAEAAEKRGSTKRSAKKSSLRSSAS